MLTAGAVHAAQQGPAGAAGYHGWLHCVIIMYTSNDNHSTSVQCMLHNAILHVCSTCANHHMYSSPQTWLLLLLPLLLPLPLMAAMSKSSLPAGCLPDHSWPADYMPSATPSNGHQAAACAQSCNLRSQYQHHQLQWLLCEHCCHMAAASGATNMAAAAVSCC